MYININKKTKKKPREKKKWVRVIADLTEGSISMLAVRDDIIVDKKKMLAKGLIKTSQGKWHEKNESHVLP